MNRELKFRLIKYFTLTMLCLFMAGMTVAQDEKFSASVSSSSVSVGDQFQLTFKLSGSGKNFRPPSFSDFNVLVGPNQSTSMQFINGSVSQTISFTYVLQAVKEGTFKIGSAEITSGNVKVLSNPLTITVSKGAAKSQAGGAQGGDAISGGKNVFIIAAVDKKNVYQGEGIGVTYKLFTKVTLLNYSINKLPSFNGFWSQEISMPQQPEFHSENYNGVSYKVADIKKVVLFPQHSGTLTIDPMEGEVIARVQVKRQKSNDPFDQFFNDPFFNNPFFNNNVQDVPVSLKSDPIKINVKELPENAPEGFSGAVGKFACEVSLDKKEISAHDAVTLKIKISGKGNIKLIDAPQVTFPPDFETYDPKENVSSNATLNGVTGTKTFEFLMIPRNAGDFKIPVAPFSYFDLEKRQYTQIPAPEITVRVGKGGENTTTVITGVNKSDVQVLGKDIRFIKTRDPEFIDDNSPMFGSPVFYSLVFAPALLFAGFFLVRRKQEQMSGNVLLIRSQRANKVAMKRLSAAKLAMTSGNKEKFLDEMFRALWGFISDKLQIPVAELSKDNVTIMLARKNVSPEVIQQFNETIDSCEFARFAGGSGESVETIYSRGIEIISRLENSIR